MINFNYFTLAPSGLDESTQQYVFEGRIEAAGDASKLPAVNLAYRFVYNRENEENGASGWQTYTVGNTISQTSDQWFGVQFRNDSGSFSGDSSNYYLIKSTYAFDVGGKIISLINFTDESATLPNRAFNHLFDSTKIHDAHELILPDRVSDYCYAGMFNICAYLTTTPELPATTLATGCYANMFNSCASLTTTPELPATTLADSCYMYMFQNCKSLATALALPATTIVINCYEGMFKGCTSLTTAPALPATTLAGSCYKYMFQGCASLTTAPALPATTLAGLCYQYMFYGCTRLQTAPELHATTLARGCYSRMFGNCSKIDRIVWKLTTIPSSTYCTDWLNGTSASGKFEYTDPTLDVASITRDASGVPAGWSISLLQPKTMLLLKINNISIDNITILGKKIASLSINGKKVKSSSSV